MENLHYYNLLKDVPEDALKEIKAGDLKGYSDINPQWRIKAFTDVFGIIGIGWYYEVKNKWLEKSGETICAFADIDLYIKVDGEWSKPINGHGGNKFSYITNQNKNKVNDECWKMAITDALSVAMKQIGVGGDVYEGKSDSKYMSPKSSNAQSWNHSDLKKPKYNESNKWFNAFDKYGKLNAAGEKFLKEARSKGFQSILNTFDGKFNINREVWKWIEDEYKKSKEVNNSNVDMIGNEPDIPNLNVEFR